MSRRRTYTVRPHHSPAGPPSPDLGDPTPAVEPDPVGRASGPKLAAWAADLVRGLADPRNGDDNDPAWREARRCATELLAAIRAEQARRAAGRGKSTPSRLPKAKPA